MRTIRVACLFWVVSCVATASSSAATLHEPGFTDSVVTTVPGAGYGGIVVHGGGNVYVTDSGGSITKVTPGGTASTLATVPSLPLGLGLIGDTLYVGFNNGQIYTLDTTLPSPTPVLFTTVPGTSGGAEDMVLSPATWPLFPEHLIVSGNQGIYAVNPTSGTTTTILVGIGFSSLDFTPDGRLLVTKYVSSGSNQILEVTAAGGTSVFNGSAASGTDGLEVHPVTGEVFLASSSQILDIIQKIDPTGSLVTTFASGIKFDGGFFPAGMAFSPNGARLYYLDDDSPNNLHVIEGFAFASPTLPCAPAGPDFPPPGGAALTETPVGGSAGDPGGMVWDFSGIQLLDFPDGLFWGASGADGVLVTLDATYDGDGLPTTILTFDNLTAGVATWTGTTHYVDPGPTPFDGIVPVRFTLTAPSLFDAASVHADLAGAGAVVDVLTAAAGTGTFSATLKFEALHDGVWQAINILLQPPACADCAGSSFTAGFYYCPDPQSACPLNGGPDFPPPGGAMLAETPAGGSAGDSGGIVWDFSAIQINDFTALYWGPAGADQVLVTLDGAYDIDGLPTTVLTFDNVSGGVATWSGVTHYVDPGPTPFDGNVPARFTLAAPQLFDAASVDPGISDAGAVVNVLIAAAGTGSFSATLKFEAFHDGVWQPVNSLLQPPACVDCAGSSITAGFYYCVDAIVSLNTTEECKGDGTLTVTVDMSGVPTTIIGGEFFLSYDNALLDFVSMDPGDPPFAVEVSEVVNEPAGAIDYEVGVSGAGTSDDSTLAFITFATLGDHCPSLEPCQLGLQGADFPPPGGATLTETPPGATAGDSGGVVWDFTGVQVNDFAELYWGAAHDGAVRVTLDGSYDLAGEPTTVLTFDNITAGVATWSGTTHYVDPGPTVFDGIVPVRFTLTAPDLLEAASVDPDIAGAGAVVDVRTAAVGTGAFAATLEVEAFHDGVWQPVNGLLQPPACTDCAGVSIEMGFYHRAVVLLGPDFPPPGGATLTETPPAGAAGDPGGVEWEQSGLQLALFSDLYWGAAGADRVRVTLDGSYDVDGEPTTILAFDNITAGVATWSGTTHYVDPGPTVFDGEVPVRFTVTAPNLLDAASVNPGIAGAGAVVDVLTAAAGTGSFTATLEIEALHDGVWQPINSLLQPQACVDCAGGSIFMAYYHAAAGDCPDGETCLGGFCNRTLVSFRLHTPSSHLIKVGGDPLGSQFDDLATPFKIDSTPPTFTAGPPNDLTIECDGSDPHFPFEAWLATTVEATDDCGSVTITREPEFPNLDFGCGGTASATVTWTAEDECGNTAVHTATFAFVDTTPPTFTEAPGNLSVECDEQSNGQELNDWLQSAVADDACSFANVSNDFSQLTEQCGRTGTTTVTWTAEDGCGRQSTHTATFTIVDSTVPSLTCPPSVEIECDESIVPGIPLGIATGGIAVYYNNNGQGETGSNEAYLRSQFDVSNTNGATFNFDPNPFPPLMEFALTDVLQPLPDQYGMDMVHALSTADGSVALPTLEARDNVDFTCPSAIPAGNVSWAINDYQGSPGAPGACHLNSVFRGPVLDPAAIVVTKRVITQTGPNTFEMAIAGELISDGTLYTPFFGALPVGFIGLNGSIFFSGTLTYDSTGDDGSDLVNFYTGALTLTANSPNTRLGMPSVSDACDEFPMPGVIYTDVSTPGPDCTVDKVTETIARTWRAEDSCGNVDTCVQTITVKDTTDPALTVPSDITVCCADPVDPLNTGSATATDNCDASPAVTHSDSAPPSDLSSATCPQTITRTWTATDDCGNVTTGDQLIQQDPCCGNGIIEGPEECDDGDTLDGDGCSSNCVLEGACCLPDGICVVTTEENCATGLSGSYQGDTTMCEPLEACCFGDNTCQMLDPLCCVDQGGTPQGPGSTCGGLEACCDSVAGACYMADRTCCLANGDTPQGPGTVCTAPEACCFGDDTCRMLDLLCCVDQGGTPQGPGSTCGGLEACCDSVAGACYMADRTCCLANGDTPQGPGTVCTAPEACCFGDDTCRMLDLLCCVDQGGTPQGPGSTCGGIEACCDSVTGACYMADRTCCLANGDTPQGPGTACSAPESCCFSDNTCRMLDPLCCVKQGGTPEGPGSTCGGTEACCDSTTGACYTADRTCCLANGDTPQGPGTACSAPESCCFSDNTCQMLDPLCCVNQGGTPEGPGSTCGGIEACCDSITGACYTADRTCCLANGDTPQGPGTACSVPEACCFGDNTCQMFDPLCCVDQGGTPQGPGSTCGGIEACCDSVTGACYMADRTCCLANGDTPNGPGSVCTATAACCLSGTCKVLDALCCLARGGVPQAPGTTCGECGSCCLADKDCLGDIVDSTCAAVGGSFNGLGSICLGDSDGDGIDDQCENCIGVDDAIFGVFVCSETGVVCETDADCARGETCKKACLGKIPTVSEWGLIVLSLLLLTAGKVYFGYRHRRLAGA